MWSQRTIFECWTRRYGMLRVDFKRLNRVVAGNGEGGMLLTAHLTQHTQEDKERKNLTYSTFSSYSSQFIINKWFYNSTLESRKCWNSVRNVGHPSLTNAAPHPRRTETTTTGPTWHSSHSPLSRTTLCTVRPSLMDRCFNCGSIIWKVMGWVTCYHCLGVATCWQFAI